MKKILLAIFILTIFCDCRKTETEKVFLRSYVMRYFDAETMRLEPVAYFDGTGIQIWLDDLSMIGDYKSTGTQKDAYDAICEKHNDMNYNRDFVTFNGYQPFATENIGFDFVSIDVTSSARFDATHPAGESLGDIVLLESSSLKPYIDSGYTLETAERNGIHYSRVSDLISEITPEQLILLGSYTHNGGSGWRYLLATLSFKDLPSGSKEHTFTVTMTADDGRVFSDTVEITFE